MLYCNSVGDTFVNILLRGFVLLFVAVYILLFCLLLCDFVLLFGVTLYLRGFGWGCWCLVILELICCFDLYLFRFCV